MMMKIFSHTEAGFKTNIKQNIFFEQRETQKKKKKNFFGTHTGRFTHKYKHFFCYIFNYNQEMKLLQHLFLY